MEFIPLVSATVDFQIKNSESVEDAFNRGPGKLCVLSFTTYGIKRVSPDYTISHHSPYDRGRNMFTVNVQIDSDPSQYCLRLVRLLL